MTTGPPVMVPTIALNDEIIFPYGQLIIRLNINQTASKKLSEDIERGIVKKVFVYVDSKQNNRNTVGVICEVETIKENQIMLKGLFRGRYIDRVATKSDNYEVITYDIHLDESENFPDLRRKAGILREVFHKFTLKSGYIRKIKKENLIIIFAGLKNPSPEGLDRTVWKLIDVLPSINGPYKDLFLPSTRVGERILFSIICLNHLEKEFNNHAGIIKNKDISQLGKELSSNPDLTKRFKRFVEISGILTQDVKGAIEDDFRKLSSGDRHHNEYSVYLTHLDVLLGLPWNKETEQEKDIAKVEAILNNDHAHLETVKRSICDFIAPKILNPKGRAAILCLIGPPGVGKTSLGDSIARALNRKFIRMSVGGLHDEAEIRGHRVTYIGSKPGRIIELIKKCGYKNPVFMIDEIDKMENSVRGDPGAALLEVLDPEQNHSFVDNYLAVPFDLTQVLFICTANVEENISEALRDRMDIIRLPGYLEIEKIEIAERFIIPRVSKEVGLNGKINIIWPEDSISKLIREYTREAGIRVLTHRIEDVFKKIAGSYLKRDIKEFTVTFDTLQSMLGPPKYTYEELETPKIGEAIGLAWTPYGGEILNVQCEFFSHNEFVISQTGLPQEVMRQSNKVALTAAKNKLSKIDLKRVGNNSIHIHIPEGAIRKDGPSAGITAFCSMYSLFTNRKIRSCVAMTGEIDLKGRIKEVEGIKEKAVAAMRAGIKEVILPKRNERNLHDVPQEVKDKIQFHLVSSVDEVIEIAFEKNPA